MLSKKLSDLASQAIKTANVSDTIRVIGCVEHHNLLKKNQVKHAGMLVTAYDHAFDNKYSECKALKKKHGWKCMAPVFSGVSLSLDYQHWTSLLRWYLIQVRDKSSNVTNKLIIQRCRGSEVDHTFNVWFQILLESDFFDSLSMEVTIHKPSETDTKSIWTVYFNSSEIATIYFRGGWEPEKIRSLPDDKENYTMFLLGTCCRFSNAQEGDLLIPRHTIRYDVDKRKLNTRPESAFTDLFACHQTEIWSEKNQAKSETQIRTSGVTFCGGYPLQFAIKDECIHPALQIQVSGIFEANKEDEFTQTSI